MKKPKLNAKQKLFVAAYVAKRNYTEAYVEAGYAPKFAYSAGPRMGERPHVKAAIDAGIAAQAVRLELKGDRVLLELMRVGYADLRQAFGPTGQLLPLSEMPEDIARALSGVDTEIREDGNVLKVRLHDKIRALELLGKNLKLWVERVETKDVTPKDPTPPLTNAERRALLKLQLAAENKP